MRKLVLTAVAGLAGLSAAAFTPSKADANPAVALELGLSADTLTPVQWGGYGGYYGRPHRHRHYGFHGGYGRPYGFYRPYRPAYAAPSCWVERRWVQTPWGPEPRAVRICR